MSQKKHDPKEEYLAVRITPSYFSSEEEAELFYQTQRDLKNKSEFNRVSIVNRTLLEANGEGDKYLRLMDIVKVRGIDEVLAELEKPQDQLTIRDVENVVYRILGSRNVQLSAIEQQEITAEIHQERERKKPTKKLSNMGR